MVRILRHRQTKGPATDRPHLNHRATSRLYWSPEDSRQCAVAEFARILVVTRDSGLTSCEASCETMNNPG